MVNGEEVCSITIKACCVRGGVIRANRWTTVKYLRVEREKRQEKQFNHGSATLRADDRLLWAPADIIISMSRSYERGRHNFSHLFRDELGSSGTRNSFL